MKSKPSTVNSNDSYRGGCDRCKEDTQPHRPLFLPNINIGTAIRSIGSLLAPDSVRQAFRCPNPYLYTVPDGIPYSSGLNPTPTTHISPMMDVRIRNSGVLNVGVRNNFIWRLKSPLPVPDAEGIMHMPSTDSLNYFGTYCLGRLLPVAGCSKRQYR